MKEQHIHDAIGEISEELIDPVAKLRQKKRYPVVKWAAAAACFGLLLSIPFHWNTFTGTKAGSINTEFAPEMNMSNSFDGLLDKSEESAADMVVNTAAFQAKVLEVHDRYIVVEPLEGEQERSSGDRFEVFFPESQRLPMFQAGTIVNIVYDGTIQEVYPCLIVGTISIDIVE